jgi:hypothetical protein
MLSVISVSIFHTDAFRRTEKPVQGFSHLGNEEVGRFCELSSMSWIRIF